MTRSETLAEELRVAVGALVRRLRAESTALPQSWPQRAVLRRLSDDGPTTTADLARAEGIKPQTMGALVADLEADGLVERRDDEHDGRRKLLLLTSSGRRALADGRAMRTTWLARAIETRLDPPEQKQLLAALDLVRKLTSTP